MAYGVWRTHRSKMNNKFHMILRSRGRVHSIDFIITTLFYIVDMIYVYQLHYYNMIIYYLMCMIRCTLYLSYEYSTNWTDLIDRYKWPCMSRGRTAWGGLWPVTLWLIIIKSDSYHSPSISGIGEIEVVSQAGVPRFCFPWYLPVLGFIFVIWRNQDAILSLQPMRPFRASMLTFGISFSNTVQCLCYTGEANKCFCELFMKILDILYSEKSS